MGSDDFEFLSEVTRAARYIDADNLDDYISDVTLRAYVKTLNTHSDFTTLTSMEYPSALDAVLRKLRNKYSYGSHQLEDILIHYGLRELWNIIKKTKIEEVTSMLESAKRYAIIPEMRVKYLYKVTGDSRRVFHVHKETAAFCSELSTKLDVTNSSVCMLALLISLKNSPMVLNNFKSINELYLSHLEDNIYNSSEQFFKELVMWLCGYCNPIYNLYCKEMLQSKPNEKQLHEMYKILIYASGHGLNIDNLIDYKSITVKHNGVKTDVVNDTKKEQIPEFETFEPVFEQQVETPIADKPITQKVVIEKPLEPKPVIVQEPLIIEKEIIIKKPVETDIKKVIKHLVKLIFNRLHLSKK